jgi:hypothetical protein
MEIPKEADWRPLAALARLARQSDELPSFHEIEFIYMGSVWNARKRLRIHLYKHRDTRRYLNLDDAGHAYEYCGSPPGDDASGGRYRLRACLRDALERADLWIFGVEPAFVRSSPPCTWPNRGAS